MKGNSILTVIFFTLITTTGYGYKIITPEPFNIVRKNYVKLQLLPESGDLPADSLFFDVLFNTGSTLTKKADASLSVTLALNEFNDGIFFVRARVYHGATVDTIGSKFDKAGIPVLLDRQPNANPNSFRSPFMESAKSRLAYFNSHSVPEFSNNNNKASFASCWDDDSLYFEFKVKDAHLNYTNASYIDLFQAKKYLQTLWYSDCIEIDFDLLHDRHEWKDNNDYELLVDVQGNYTGNRWNVSDSMYAHWANRTRISVHPQGSVNNNQDTDTGYTITVAIPWAELGYTPHNGKTIGLDVQYYDKDGAMDEAFRTSISGTNPESNDNSSEWVTIILEKSSPSMAYWLLLLLPVAGVLAWWAFGRKRKAVAVPSQNMIQPGESKTLYSDTIQKAIQYIADHYEHTGLSRHEIAEQVFLSEQYLSTLFKKETGVNLVTYINQYRVQRAIELLQTTRLSVSEIAYKVGYNSVQNFHKNFKTITQKAPSDYR